MAGTFSGWTEALLVSIAFIIILGGIVISMNQEYGKTNSLPFVNLNESSLPIFESQINQSSGDIAGGGVSLEGGFGGQLTNGWTITKAIWSTLTNFLSGGWITESISYLNLGNTGMVIGVILRILYILSLIITILFMVFKVVI